MKKILFILVFFVCGIVSAQQYFFNGTVHVPKTTAEINAISSPVEGRQEANSDTGTIYYYNGSDWVDTGKPLVDASGFSGNLNSNITDLQLLAEAVDSLTISGSIADGSITEAKLSTSVNASLDLADSALQSGDNVSELVNDAGYITEGGNLIPVTQAEYDSIALNHPQQILDNDYAIVDEDDGSGSGVVTGDSGTTGLVLEGSTSGTHTVGSQQWSWSRSGDIVYVYITLQAINGASTGTFQINFSGTTIPSYGSNFSLLNVQAYNCPVNFYSIYGRMINSATHKIFIGYQDASDGTNQTSITDASFSNGSFVISGTYITND